MRPQRDRMGVFNDIDRRCHRRTPLGFGLAVDSGAATLLCNFHVFAHDAPRLLDLDCTGLGRLVFAD